MSPNRIMLTLLGWAAVSTVMPGTGFGNAIRVLGTDAPTSCTKCEGHLLPGGPVYPESPKYSVHSDLPEIFHTPGVLYSTRKVLPPFDTYKDGPLSETMRTQQGYRGFTTMDGDFEVFLYHMTEPGQGKSPRRVGVLVENAGKTPVTIKPSEIMETTGAMAKPKGPEIRLSTRYQTRDLTSRYGPVTVAPGAVELISLSPRIGDGTAATWIGTKKDPVPAEDRSVSKFLTGQVLGQVVAEGGSPSFHVHVVGMDAGEKAPETKDRKAWTALARKLLAQGAKSGETAMDLRIPPPACHVRRVAGVYRTFRWEGAATVTPADLATTTIRFQMALPAAQAGNCMEAVQTQPMLLSPPYVRPETIGNYMVQYLVQLNLDNTSGTKAQSFDLSFGKQDASIGLSWQVLLDEAQAQDPRWKTIPVQEGWAGAWSLGDRADNTLPFLAQPVVVEKGKSQTVTLYFTVAGSSSLPFQIHVAPGGGRK